MTIPELCADIKRRIAIERAAKRCTRGLEKMLADYTHRDLRQAPQRAGRMKQRQEAA